MAEPRLKPGCDGKIKHKSHLSAEYSAEHENGGKIQVVYKCKICNHFHVATDKNVTQIKKQRPPKEKKIIRKFKLFKKSKNDNID